MVPLGECAQLEIEQTVAVVAGVDLKVLNYPTHVAWLTIRPCSVVCIP